MNKKNSRDLVGYGNKGRKISWPNRYRAKVSHALCGFDYE